MTCCTVKTVKSGTKTNSIRETVKMGARMERAVPLTLRMGVCTRVFTEMAFPKDRGR